MSLEGSSCVGSRESSLDKGVRKSSGGCHKSDRLFRLLLNHLCRADLIGMTSPWTFSVLCFAAVRSWAAVVCSPPFLCFCSTAKGSNLAVVARDLLTQAD
jgi:hypothetical protein